MEAITVMFTLLSNELFIKRGKLKKQKNNMSGTKKSVKILCAHEQQQGNLCLLLIDLHYNYACEVHAYFNKTTQKNKT